MTVYHRPSKLSEVLDLLAGGGTRVIAGGTDVYPVAGAVLIGDIVDVTGVAELGQITMMADHLRIGAAVTWGQIARTALPPALAGLQAAALQVGGRQIQNVGTIGGNLCNASPAADGIPPLLVADAEVELACRSGKRRVALDQFLIAPRKVGLNPAEVLSAVILPLSGLAGQSAFEKLGARTHLVISIAMVAVRLVVAGGRVAQVAVAVGSCSGVARRLSQVEAALLGQPLADLAGAVRQADVACDIAPIDDVRATAAYRVEAATVLVRRALAKAAGSAP
jgi:CO/xanthine dehydrogenase FAD-binding subunit